jgi:serine-threonine kinase receptor-associated protein
MWVRGFDFETGADLECHKGYHGPIWCVRFVPGGTLYATGWEYGNMGAWSNTIMENRDSKSCGKSVSTVNII